METRTTQSTVTFGRPFQLTGMESIAPAGVYKLDVEEEKLDTLTFESWRRTVVTLQIAHAGITEYVTLAPEDLRDALQRDGDLPPNPAAPKRIRHIRGQLRPWSQRA
jgi:hypothetical protein